MARDPREGRPGLTTAARVPQRRRMVPPVPEALSPERARARLGAGTWLDVRDDDAFAAAHLPGSGSVPLARWAERRHECPPHGRAIVVIADDPAAASEAAR